MDSYLEIAQTVLAASRRPMTATGILEAAYVAKIVPKHLYGQTQVKTLRARLSEDILYNQHSAFFRTEPGYFFLNKLLSDLTIPSDYKEKFEARRRTRDLHVAPFLVIDERYVAACDQKLMNDWHLFITTAEKHDAIHYLQSRKEVSKSLVVWTFSIVRRGTEVLSYRTGRYRNDENTFTNKRTIGFPGVISFYDCTLFSDRDYGAKENAMDAIIADLDISAIAIHGERLPSPEPRFIIRVRRDSDEEVLLIVMDWICPAWFEPTTRRLSLNDPRWLNFDVQPNNIHDFEPWTRATLDALCTGGGRP